ncbi:hypothetical protein TNCV_918191 [Trichonephila clavipes]|nr:hypothetical protein TNCV_918191 [Trichonephila clavipes]
MQHWDLKPPRNIRPQVPFSLSNWKKKVMKSVMSSGMNRANKSRVSAADIDGRYVRRVHKNTAISAEATRILDQCLIQAISGLPRRRNPNDRGPDIVESKQQLCHDQSTYRDV